jgi:outer membrane immunogenic protein
MLRKLLLASAAGLGFCGFAHAADMVLKAPAPVYVPTWTGCYVGGHVGYGKGDATHHVQLDDVAPGEFIFTDNFSPKGFAGGGQGGCQLQTGNFLWGIEGDWTSLSNSDSRSYGLDGGDSVAFSSGLNSLWSVRGRFGIVTSEVYHLYATAGIGGARAKYSFSLNDTDAGVFAGNVSANPTGIVAGAGAEWKVWPNVVLRAEYLHYAISADTVLPTSLPALDIGPNLGDRWSTKNVDVIRVGASYLFNFGR